MRIKKFSNLWAMGLILCVGLILGIYIIKLCFPNFVVGVAETPKIVEIGKYIDTHLWAYYLFNTVNSFIPLWLFSCAVCRKKKLNYKENIAILLSILLYFIIEKSVPNIALAYNFALYAILPLCVIKFSKIEYDVFKSFAVSYIVTVLAQAFSLEIRDISLLISNYNTATYTILLIDGTIWNVLLYLYFNKGEEQNGKTWIPSLR